MELEGSDAVSSVPFSRDLWSQDLQAVPGGEACKDTSAVNSTWVSRVSSGVLHLADLLEEEGSCWSRSPDEEFQLIWKLMCLRLQHQNKVTTLTTSVPKLILWNYHRRQIASVLNNMEDWMKSIGCFCPYQS